MLEIPESHVIAEQLSQVLSGKPCPHYGYLIHKESYMGGTIYYCEHCQK